MYLQAQTLEFLGLIVLYLLYILVVVLMQVYDSRRARFERKSGLSRGLLSSSSTTTTSATTSTPHFFVIDRIPTIADVDVLKTYFANREATNLKPQIPRRERAYSVQAKLGKFLTISPPSQQSYHLLI